MTVVLTCQEPQAVAFVQERHPFASLELTNFRDSADVGWLRIRAEETFYIVSPTGRVWPSADGLVRIEPSIRGQSYDQRPRSPR